MIAIPRPDLDHPKNTTTSRPKVYFSTYFTEIHPHFCSNPGNRQTDQQTNCSKTQLPWRR